MFHVEMCFLNLIFLPPFLVLYHQVTASIPTQCVFMNGNTFLHNADTLQSMFEEVKKKLPCWES